MPKAAKGTVFNKNKARVGTGPSLTVFSHEAEGLGPAGVGHDDRYTGGGF